MESRLVPIHEVIQKGAWHYQPYSQAVQAAEALLEQSPYPVVSLRQLVQHQQVSRGFTYPSNAYQTEGVPFLRLTNLKPTGLDLSEVVYISPADHQKLHQTQLQQGDVVIGLVATAGPIQAAVYEFDQPANINQHIARLSLTDQMNPHYLVYYLTSEVGQTLLQSRMTGAITKTISISALLELPVICPPLEEQARIVANMRSLQQQATQHLQKAGTLQREANQTFDHLLREGAA